MTVTAAIILAASEATIDGAPLALSHVDSDTTLIEWQIAQLQAAGVDVIEVVLGFEADRIIPLVAGNDVDPIVDACWQDGEPSWLRTGTTAVPRDTAAAIIISIEHLLSLEGCGQMLASQRNGAEITLAQVAGKTRRFPIIASASALAQLRSASPEHGLDAIVAFCAEEANVIRIDATLLPPAIRGTHSG